VSAAGGSQDWQQLALTSSADGVLLPLKVVPGASRTRLVGLHGDALKVQVAAPPADGQANAAVLDLLATQLAIARRNLQLCSGSQSSQKIIAITGLSAEQLRQRLRDCLATPR